MKASVTLLALALFVGFSQCQVSAMTPDEREQQRINKRLEKLNQFHEMMRKQGKLPSQKIKEAPKDSYSGSDKKQIKEFAQKTWKKAFPKDEILDIRIQMKEWEKRKEKRWNTTGDSYIVDFSTIQALIFVKKDEQSALIYPLDISKDHTDGDKLSSDAASAKAINVLAQEIALSDMKAE